MDCAKVGKLILRLRKERGFSQNDLAQHLHVTSQAISKWERGLGCPDVTLLAELSEIFSVDISSVLSGSLNEKSKDVGKMKNMQFYVCPQCQNILTASSKAEVSCCGRKLEVLVAQKVDEHHKVRMSLVEDEVYLEILHPMSKEHYISFVAQVHPDKVLLTKLYSEQDAALRIPQGSVKLYFYCSRDGLFEVIS